MNGATFVARGFSGDAKQLIQLMGQAIEHKGFALIDVFSRSADDVSGSHTRPGNDLPRTCLKARAIFGASATELSMVEVARM